MPRVTYIEFTGREHLIDVAVGYTLMEGARDAGVPGIVAECGGACACSTCHVYVAAGWIDRLPNMGSMEEDMLDFAPGFEPGRSRLSCQIRMTEELDGLIMNIPEAQA
jgi:2Fe-2S ferredoxin